MNVKPNKDSKGTLQAPITTKRTHGNWCHFKRLFRIPTRLKIWVTLPHAPWKDAGRAMTSFWVSVWVWLDHLSYTHSCMQKPRETFGRWLYYETERKGKVTKGVNLGKQMSSETWGRRLQANACDWRVLTQKHTYSSTPFLIYYSRMHSFAQPIQTFIISNHNLFHKRLLSFNETSAWHHSARPLDMLCDQCWVKPNRPV